jgi:alpha-beta hydrolase superfamily lysophospholipase
MEFGRRNPVSFREASSLLSWMTDERPPGILNSERIQLPVVGNSIARQRAERGKIMLKSTQWKRWLVILLAACALWQAAGAEPARAAAGEQGRSPERTKSPYATHALSFNNREVSLAGSLVLPAQGSGPFPAVVMLHGSGPDTRQIFWQTGDAEAFLRAGIAVFIYDKRGTGDSTGDWHTASLEDLAEDAAAAVELVRSQPEIHPGQVGVFGVSQGGSLAPLVAARTPGVAFAINVSGSGTPLANQELWSAGNELRQRGFSEGAIEDTMQVMHLAFSARPLIKSGLLPLGDLYLWFVPIDPYLAPAVTWQQFAQPLYVAYGAADPVMPAGASVAAAQTIFAARQNPYDRLVVYPGARHGVRLPSGAWAPGHIARMTTWVLDVTQGRLPEPAPDLGVVDTGENRWFGLGAARTPWYATFAVQLGLFLFFGVVFGLGLLLALNPRARLALPGVGSLPRVTLLAASVINLLLLAGLLVVLGYLAFADPNGSRPQVPYAGLLAALSGISVLLAAGMVFFALGGRRLQAWTSRVRVVYTLVALAAAGYLAFLLYWNLLGTPL